MPTQKQGGQPYEQPELFDPEPFRVDPDPVVRQADPDTWLTKQQLAKRLGMSLRTVERRLIGWPHHRDGHQLIRFSPSDIEIIEVMTGRSS